MKTVFFKYRFQFGIGCCVLLCLCSCKRPLELREAFDKVSEIDRFEIEEYESDRYGFPESFGEAIVCVHPNSSCREKVISVLSNLPQKSLAFEATIDGQIDRFYCIHFLDKQSPVYAHRSRKWRCCADSFFECRFSGSKKILIPIKRVSSK